MTNNCRFCNHPLQHTFVDLGKPPIANDYLTTEELNKEEKFYPLHTYVCEKCLLVQLEELATPDHIFGDGDYAYFSSYSESWLAHAKAYTDLIVEKFGFNSQNQGKSIVGYGAPAKGNTLLNYCQIGRDLIDYTVDRNPHKQGLFLPGTHIPIFHPDMIRETRPDYLLILPWNLKDEVINQMSFIREWGGKFVVPIPEVNVYQSSAPELMLIA